MNFQSQRDLSNELNILEASLSHPSYIAYTYLQYILKRGSFFQVVIIVSIPLRRQSSLPQHGSASRVIGKPPWNLD